MKISMSLKKMKVRLLLKNTLQFSE